MLESVYQAKLIKRLRATFEDCYILKNDANYIQGFPDLTILYCDRWAVLEVKASAEAELQPNQAFYVSELNHMSFAAVIYPENENEVFRDLQSALASRGSSRSSKC